jgi:Family of unknown function (DUF6489)
MKITMEVDCTPSEARRFFGLPDLEPVQQAVMKGLEEQILQQMTKFPAEGLLKNWLSAGTLSAETMQNFMSGIFKHASDSKAL